MFTFLFWLLNWSIDFSFYFYMALLVLHTVVLITVSSVTAITLTYCLLVVHGLYVVFGILYCVWNLTWRGAVVDWWLYVSGASFGWHGQRHLFFLMLCQCCLNRLGMNIWGKKVKFVFIRLIKLIKSYQRAAIFELTTLWSILPLIHDLLNAK